MKTAHDYWHDYFCAAITGILSSYPTYLAPEKVVEIAEDIADEMLTFAQGKGYVPMESENPPEPAAAKEEEQ